MIIRKETNVALCTGCIYYEDSVGCHTAPACMDLETHQSYIFIEVPEQNKVTYTPNANIIYYIANLLRKIKNLFIR